ncbi:MAG: SDR family NAD(P)-dependent oxidoreductase, partial [Paracoccaceae bacterium]
MTQTALITGGQQGIGLGIATALANAGFHVVIAAEQPATAAVVQTALAQLGRKARYIRHDLTNLAAIPALLDEIGPLTTLISNAGVPARQRGDMLELTPENFDHTLNIN